MPGWHQLFVVESMVKLTIEFANVVELGVLWQFVICRASDPAYPLQHPFAITGESL